MRRSVTHSAAALILAAMVGGASCSGGRSGASAHRQGDGLDLTGNEHLATVQGTVTIGPLCPVERIPPDPACSPGPETFRGLQVLVLTLSGELVRAADVDGSGSYAVQVEPGSYLIDMNRHLGLPSGGDSGGGVADSAVADSAVADSAYAVPDSVTATDSAAGAPSGFPGSPADSGTATGRGTGGDGDGGPYRVLPVRVDLSPGEVLRVDIDIDTGIR
jgi:hypothetical protein